MYKVLIILLLLCFGCQTGRIPCPKFKGTKSGHHKKYRNYSASLTAKAEEKETEPKLRGIRPVDEKYVQHVSVEEWDCPQPGARKYMPRNVKENIKRNAKRVKEDARRMSSDTTSVE